MRNYLGSTRKSFSVFRSITLLLIWELLLFPSAGYGTGGNGFTQKIFFFEGVCSFVIIMTIG